MYASGMWICASGGHVPWAHVAGQKRYPPLSWGEDLEPKYLDFLWVRDVEPIYLDEQLLSDWPIVDMTEKWSI